MYNLSFVVSALPTCYAINVTVASYCSLKENKDMANLVRELLLELRTGSQDGNQSLLLEASQRLHVSPDVRQHCMSMTQELNKKLESSSLCPLHVVFTSQTSIASIHSWYVNSVEMWSTDHISTHPWHLAILCFIFMISRIERIHQLKVLCFIYQFCAFFA